MFYTFVLQVLVLIVIVGVMSQSNVGSNQQVKMDYYKVTMIYQKEFMIKEAIERHIYDYNALPNPLTVQELKDKNEIPVAFIDTNGIDAAGLLSYTIVNNNYVRVSHTINDDKLRKVYLNHYKGSGNGIKPYAVGTTVYHEFQLSNKAVDILKGRVNDGEGYIPVGAIQAFAVDYATANKCPIGWLAANGGIVDAVAYPILAGMLPTLPDYRGEFLRGVDDSRGVDTGRIMGSYQSNDQKSFSIKSESAVTVNTGPVYMGKYTGDHNNNEFFTGKWETPGTKVNIWWDNSEVRPRNIAVRYCIKHDYN